MMKRFTMTPQPRKSISIPTSTIKPSAFPRTSIAADDLKPPRNVRDRAYKQACCENIIKFLTDNNYEAPVNAKTLMNPSNKDFQNIFKFIYSFIDSTPFMRFEDDIISILRMLRYPYSGEITRSQLSAVTPHTWPVLLSMMNWMVGLVNRSDEAAERASTVENEFFDFVCEGYGRFMEGNEEDGDIEEEFVARISNLHSKEGEEIEHMRKEAALLANELENLMGKFVDIEKLGNKKKKINDDLNTLILHEKQLENKKSKYIAAIEKLADEISAADAEIDGLIGTKNVLAEQISQQMMNPEDIKGMNAEKMGLLKELEKLKPERERLVKALKGIEDAIADKTEENDALIVELNSFKSGLDLSQCFSESRGLDYSVMAVLETELGNKQESLVNYEISVATLEDKIADKMAVLGDLENQYGHCNQKLQTIGAIYLEKKELSDRSQQKNRNEMDRLDNDLLKLKLENDSAFLKSEKEYSEAKIKLDILVSNIAREKEEIGKHVWDFYNNSQFSLEMLDAIGKDVKKLMK